MTMASPSSEAAEIPLEEETRKVLGGKQNFPANLESCLYLTLVPKLSGREKPCYAGWHDSLSQDVSHLGGFTAIIRTSDFGKAHT